MHPDSDDDGIDAFGGPPSVGASSNSSRPTSAMDNPLSSGLTRPAAMSPKSPGRILRGDANSSNQGMLDHIPERDEQGPGGIADQTTLLHNDEEGFALAPIDTSAVKGIGEACRIPYAYGIHCNYSCSV